MRGIIGLVKNRAFLMGLAAAMAWTAATCWKCRMDGRQACEVRAQKAVDRRQDRERELIDRLRKAEVTREAKIEERIVYVKQQPDPSGCLRQPAPAGVIRDLGGVPKPESRRRARPRTAQADAGAGP
jgi:hypothetical protein